VRTTPPIAPMSNALPVRRAGGPRAGSRARVPLGRGAGTPAIAARVVGRYGGFGSRDSTRGVAASARREGMTCLAGLATTASLRRCVRFSSCGRAACGPLGGEREQRAGVRGGAEREQQWVRSTRARNHRGYGEAAPAAVDFRTTGAAFATVTGRVGRGCGRRSAAVVRCALLLGSTNACLGALDGPLELPETRQRRGPRAVHLRPVQGVAVALVASLRQEVLDRRRIDHHSPRLRASSVPNRCPQPAFGDPGVRSSAAWPVAWVATARDLPTLWWGCPRDRKRERDPTANAAGPTSLDRGHELHASARFALRLISGPGRKSCPRGQRATTDPYSLSGQTTSGARGRTTRCRRGRARRLRCAFWRCRFGCISRLLEPARLAHWRSRATSLTW
jgi:hypothetical protein